MKKKVIIIGAGISGLTAGVYAQRSGFDVTIYEQHNIPGGLSTSWSRKGYFFEGGMHWLTGSSPKLALNRVWKEVGALKENNPIYTREILSSVVGGGKDGGDLHLYRNAEKMRDHFLENAPEDRKAVMRLYRDTKAFQKVHLPINDLFGVKTTKPCHPSLWELVSMAGAGLKYPVLTKETFEHYVNRFSNPNIRHLLSSLIGSRYNALSFVYSMGAFSSGDCGFPQGGSLRMAQNMADTFTSLGGTISYRSKVQKVAVENGKACGVYLNGALVPADSVIVALDSRTAVDTMFEPRLEEKWISKLRGVTTEQNLFFGLGIEADLSKYPFSIILPLETPFNVGGNTYSNLRLYNYAAMPGYAPEGCSTLTCLVMGDFYDWWKAKKDEGTYRAEKEKALADFIKIIENAFPETKGKTAAADLATPCTYERYTASYKGSWMSVWEPGGSSFIFPSASKSVEGLYFASERNQMPGGLPICAWAGRKAAQCLCRDNSMTFNCGE
ncbi:MAG TPA: NAD(P)/FAD-dependent oxidoreductase [Treponema sp.]|nr:NAD(P)/FAD-dependent oxidoreductase [Treponema sp.]